MPIAEIPQGYMMLSVRIIQDMKINDFSRFIDTFDLLIIPIIDERNCY